MGVIGQVGGCHWAGRRVYLGSWVGVIGLVADVIGKVGVCTSEPQLSEPFRRHTISLDSGRVQVNEVSILPKLGDIERSLDKAESV